MATAPLPESKFTLLSDIKKKIQEASTKRVSFKEGDPEVHIIEEGGSKERLSFPQYIGQIWDVLKDALIIFITSIIFLILIPKDFIARFFSGFYDMGTASLPGVATPGSAMVPQTGVGSTTISQKGMGILSGLIAIAYTIIKLTMMTKK